MAINSVGNVRWAWTYCEVNTDYAYSLSEIPCANYALAGIIYGFIDPNGGRFFVVKNNCVGIIGNNGELCMAEILKGV